MTVAPIERVGVALVAALRGEVGIHPGSRDLVRSEAERVVDPRELPVRVGAVLDWLALVALGVFMAYLTRYAADVVLASWQQGATANTPLATPLWIPQALWVAGLAWMCVVLALMLVRACIALVTGDLATLKAICGMRRQSMERLALSQ